MVRDWSESGVSEAKGSLFLVGRPRFWVVLCFEAGSVMVGGFVPLRKCHDLELRVA